MFHAIVLQYFATTFLILCCFLRFTVKDMKDRWKNIRDSYVKHIKQGKSGDSAAKKKKYIYADALSFLLKTIEEQKTPGSTEGDANDEEEHQDEVRSVEDDTEESLAASIFSDDSRTKYRQRDKANLTPFQSELLKKLTEIAQQEEDVDKAFLFSLLPEYKQLSAVDKFNFKMMNLQFFENIRKAKENLQPDQMQQSSVPYFSQ